MMIARSQASLGLAVGLTLVLVGAPAHALDTVLLVEGGRVRGTVMVEDASGVSIRLPDGTVRTYKKSEVREVRYDESGVTGPSAPAPAPPSSSAPAPALGASCVRDADCAAGQGCDARGVCMAPTALGAAACARDADCGPGQGCNAQNVCASFGAAAPPSSSDGAPPGYRYESKPIKGLAVAGFVLFGATYVLTIATGAIVSSVFGSKKVGEHTAASAVPLVGGVLADVGAVEDYSSKGAPAGTVLTVLQVTGLTLGIVGLAVKRRTLVRVSEANGRATSSVVPSVAPWATGTGGGLVLGGRF
jgi:hypothetical protein